MEAFIKEQLCEQIYVEIQMEKSKIKKETYIETIDKCNSPTKIIQQLLLMNAVNQGLDKLT